MSDLSTWEASKPSLKYISSPDFGKPPLKANECLQELGAPAVDSFNFMLHGGLTKAVKDIPPVEFALKNGSRVSIRFNEVTLQNPLVADGAYRGDRKKGKDEGVKLVYPKECRMRKASYKGALKAQIGWSVGDDPQAPFDKHLGDVPIMLRSDACNLGSLSPEECVKHGEHDQEWGGYFVMKGHERIIRMLSATRKNYPLTVIRESWKKRGKLFTEKGVFLRCVKEDMTSTNNVLHYLQNGTVKFMCSHRKALHILPLFMILKALCDRPDSYIHEQLTIGLEDDLYYMDRIAFMLRQVQDEGLYSREHARQFIGRSFRVKLLGIPEWYTDEEVCEFLLKKCVCIHLKNDRDKFNLLVFMTRKLFSFAQGKCALEGMDPVMMQEVTCAGHVYLQLLKDRLTGWLNILKMIILKKQRLAKSYSLSSSEMGVAIQNSPRIDAAIDNFLSTGNVPATADIGLMQETGLCIMAENINRMRYMSHFRAIHRGAIFADSRTSEVRQLKPDAWGFLCPVHTPDGSPCGLLNHFSSTCRITKEWADASKVEQVLYQLGMIPVSESRLKPTIADCFVVMLEGRVLGRVPDKDASRMVDKLRMLKIKADDDRVPDTLEIVFVPRLKGGQYPGIYLFVGPARMMRPVYNLASRSIEQIGTFEQVYLNICVVPEEAYEGITTHQELSQTSFLSNLACLIPLPDFNQSPRNMYQCQMSKQTMGTPVHNWPLQTENKLYRIQTPNSPLLRPAHWDRLACDDFASGTNAIVAVISYTGYDMEDAMVINRSSLQRGFANGQVYKSEFIDLKEIVSRVSTGVVFQRDPAKTKELENFIDADGLPYPGTRLTTGDPYYCYIIREEGRYVVVNYKGSETVYVFSVKLCGNDLGNAENSKICVTYIIPRNPQIGDKFASRAGQKGICSQQWLHEDLPFTESGLVPDIIFNPHGFPSRMTIAMMIEIMAGKSAAVHGLVHDATPFKFSEENTGIDYHGKLLEQAGYNYYGTERVYSGVDGREMVADIFFGLVYYQRLRHMVSDKFQVRSVGPVDVLTHQPVKGRKRGGGIRFGEMERDGLVSHGAFYLLYDRLFNCSDQATIEVCRDCGTFLPPLIELPSRNSRHGAYTRANHLTQKCNICPNGGHMEEIMIPYVYKYLLAELGSINLRMCMSPGVV